MELLSPEHEKYKNILQKNPRSKAFAPLADIYRKYAMMDEALKVIQVGMRHNPDYVPGHLALARCYYDQGRYELCHSTLGPLIGVNRDNFKLQNLFVEVCEELELWEEALEACRCLEYLDPKNGAWAERIRFLKNKISPEAEEFVARQKKTFFQEERLSHFPEDADEWSQLNFFSDSPGKTPGHDSSASKEQNSLMEAYDKKFGAPEHGEEHLTKVKKGLKNFCNAINKRAASFLPR